MSRLGVANSPLSPVSFSGWFATHRTNYCRSHNAQSNTQVARPSGVENRDSGPQGSRLKTQDSVRATTASPSQTIRRSDIQRSETRHRIDRCPEAANRTLYSRRDPRARHQLQCRPLRHIARHQIQDPAASSVAEPIVNKTVGHGELSIASRREKYDYGGPAAPTTGASTP